MPNTSDLRAASPRTLLMKTMKVRAGSDINSRFTSKLRVLVQMQMNNAEPAQRVCRNFKSDTLDCNFTYRSSESFVLHFVSSFQR